MEVILLEKVKNLGALGETVNVKPGFGRNFLVPYGKAVIATEANLKEFESRRAELEKRAQEQLSAAEKRAKSLEDVSIEIKAQASEEGKLYGSIGTREIANSITSAGVEVNKSEVRMPEGVIRFVGEYDIQLQLHSDVTAEIKVNVIAS